MTNRRGLFVTFEGGEGSGKTTQCELLALRLRAGGWNVIHAREPGGTRLGEEIRRLLLHPEEPLGVETELLLFLTARAELVRSVIKPALDEGGAVICDRFSDSTFAYQGYGRGLDLETVRRLNDFATGGLVPDLTVLLDLPSDAGLARKGDDDDAFQREDDSFHDRVNAGYLALAQAEPERWLVLDATAPPHELAQAIAAHVERLHSGLQ
ncbi:MAG TPA: dTMP kinase [Dehalococcoidia bacterium]|nr:dTMP kinase [Dehalococcoidia bacterium]